MTTDDAQSLVAGAPIRRVRRPLLLAAIGLLLVIGLVLGDMWQSRREMNHLLDAVTVSNTAIGSAFQSINPMMQNATGVNQSQSDLDAARKAIQLRCVEAEADVQDRGALVSEAFVLPWHRSLVTAQDAYSTVSHAWQHKLTACADDASRWADGSTTAQILASFKAAHRAFTNAVPPGDQPDRSRVEVLFKE